MPTPGTETIEIAARSWRLDAVPTEQGRHYIPLPDNKQDGKTTTHGVQTILAEPATLYKLWRDISLLPRWQEHVVSVTAVSESVSHWVMGDPEDEKGRRFEFDSELIEDIAGNALSWRSLTPDFEQSGGVTFVAAPSGRGTLVTLIESVKTPGSGLSAAIAGTATRGPRQTVIENLRHFKQLAETGEIPSIKGQPHGPRGLSGGFKEWLYGENNPTPPGISDRS